MLNPNPSSLSPQPHPFPNSALSSDSDSPPHTVTLPSNSSFDFADPPRPISSGSGIRVSEEEANKYIAYLHLPNAQSTEIGPGLGHDGSNSDCRSLDLNTFADDEGKRKRELGMDMSVDLDGSECVISYEIGEGFVNLPSGNSVIKRRLELANLEDMNFQNSECRGQNNDSFGCGLSEDHKGSAKRSRKTRKEELGKDDSLELLPNSVGVVKLGFQFERQILADSSISGSKFLSSRTAEEDNERGKRKLVGSSWKVEKSSYDYNGSVTQRRFSREEKGKEVLIDAGSLSNVLQEAELGLESKTKNTTDNRNSEFNHSTDNVAFQQFRNTNSREYGSRKNETRERFRDIAKENAPRYAHFAPDEKDDHSSPTLELEHDFDDRPTPFSEALKTVKDRVMKSTQQGCVSSDRNLPASISWVKINNKAHVGARFLVPSLQELCLKILADNADAIVSLDCVPDALRHRLSQLLCDSRKMNSHFFELLVSGSPTEIRLRDCSWLTEEQFTKSFQMCDTANLGVLQLDQCGRCMPDYVVLDTLALSPRRLPTLTTLSLTGACRLSDDGLRALISSAPILRSINLSQCSLLTTESLNILANSLGSFLKELYLDECQNIDAAIIVPTLKKLEHLEVLSLAGIPTVRDEFVQDYIVARGQNMKELGLKDCVDLTDKSMKVIAENCPGLCVLDLMNLCKLTDLSIRYLANSCRALHTLKLLRNPFSDEAIAAFIETTGESLKELSLNNIKKVGHQTTLSLASHAKNLHTLDLSWCRNLTDNELCLIVGSCLSLRLLKLFGCTQVTDAFLNGQSHRQIQIVGLMMSPVLKHVKVPDPHQDSTAKCNMLLAIPWRRADLATHMEPPFIPAEIINLLKH